jgi:hypothetical protein
MQRPARHNQLFILIKFLSLIILPLQLVYMPVLFYELLVFHNVRADEILTLERLKKSRLHIELPSAFEGSVLIMSKSGTGMAMFSMGKNFSPYSN